MRPEHRARRVMRSIPDDTEKKLGELRPKLHRYCSRMASSVVDGEDLVQEVLVKALEAFPGKQINSLESWLFRVAHNAAVDFLRRRRRQEDMRSEEDPDMTIDTTASAMDRHVAAASLRTLTNPTACKKDRPKRPVENFKTGALNHSATLPWMDATPPKAGRC
jgi:RNA polymerase sigma factor (sigma-70 family)